MNRVLKIDGNGVEFDTLDILMEHDGFVLYEAGVQDDIIDIIESEEIQLVMIDIERLTNRKLEIIRLIRLQSDVPLMVVSRLNTEVMKISALNAGADDYVTLPCNPLEIVARVKSQLRRYLQMANVYQNISSIYRADDLVIDDSRRRVTVGEREVKLTPIEYKILKLLVRERGKVFSISQIYESIWHMQAIGADNTIAVHIRHIREKIESNPKEPRYLKVVWGTGYKVG